MRYCLGTAQYLGLLAVRRGGPLQFLPVFCPSLSISQMNLTQLAVSNAGSTVHMLLGRFATPDQTSVCFFCSSLRSFVDLHFSLTKYDNASVMLVWVVRVLTLRQWLCNVSMIYTGGGFICTVTAVFLPIYKYCEIILTTPNPLYRVVL